MTAAAQQQATRVRRLVATLVRGGLRRLVVSPGSRSTPMVQAAAEYDELQLFSVLDERSAAFFALGLHRGDGGLSGTLCTSGSALGHALPACIEAVESGHALVIVSADRPTTVRGLGAPQAILQPGLLAPYAHCVELDATADLDAALLEVASVLQEIARTGGVLHVNVPLDVPLALLAGTLPVGVAPPSRPSTAADQPELPARDQGERVLLVAGPLPADAELQRIVAQIAAHRRIVFLAEVTSNLGPLATIRHADALLRDPQIRRNLLPDRIVRIGAWPVGKGLQSLLDDARGLCIPVDVVHPRRSDPLRQARTTILAPPATPLRMWRLGPAEDGGGWRARWQAADAAVERLEPPGAVFSEVDLIRRTAHSLGPGDCLVLGNSLPVRDWETFAPRHAPVTLHASRGANGIDGTLATALGIAVASERPTTLYLGDCTFLHDIGSLQLISHIPAVSLRVVVANNDGGAIFDHLPARAAMPATLHRGFFTTPHGLDLTAIAQGFGIPACRVRTDRECATVLQPLPPGGMQVLEALLDASASFDIHHAWWHAVAETARVPSAGEQEP